MPDESITEKFDLKSKVFFNHEAGKIWLDESRMLLLHAQAYGAQRKEIIELVGEEIAKGIFLRAGFRAGQLDAEFALKHAEGADSYDVFSIGPELHGLEGIVKSTIVDAKIDWQEGSFYGEVKFENSWEAESHINDIGSSSSPCCWSIIGYASGFVSGFFKRFIVFKESQCLVQGHEHCRMVGKPAEVWGEESHLQYFRPVYSISPPSISEIDNHAVAVNTEASPQVDSFVGQSPGFTQVLDLIKKAASAPVTVLLLGETGVGKEMFARKLHELSDRKNGPFIAINCGAIPNDLIESELFGVQKGAFTGATESRPGRFERADGGTLLLDEVGDLSMDAQVKLLRAIQTGEVERLGDNTVRKVNVRLVAATNIDLQEAISDSRFRRDLYYRLSTYPVHIPSLRERKSDIPLLVANFLQKLSASYQKSITGLSDEALGKLVDYPWPGNIRELQNVMERAVLLTAEGSAIQAESLFPDEPHNQSPAPPTSSSGVFPEAWSSKVTAVKETIEEGFDLNKHEAEIVKAAVAQSDGNLTHAAQLLGITRRQLAYRYRKIMDEKNKCPTTPRDL